MGSVAKVIKKVTKRIKRPISKITKGIARGIAKVGKAVVRGVGKLGKKLGPMGMIGLAIAMPYAMGGLSSMIGTAGVPQLGYQATGMMGHSNIFIRSIGNVGNAIRTIYQATTGRISSMFRSVTNSISEGFSSMGKGDNIFSRISRGAKDLFRNARFESRKLGSVKVKGYGGPFDYMRGNVSRMTSQQAAGVIEQGVVGGIDAEAQILSHTPGKTSWFTKTNKFDRAITDTINKTYKENVMSNWDPSAIRAHADYTNAAMGNNSYQNAKEIGDMMQSNLTSTSPGQNFKSEFNFAKSGDYGYNAGTKTYTFNGNKSFNVNGKSTLDKVKSSAKGVALDKMKESLLTPSSHVDAFNLPITLGDMTQETSGATTFGGTTIQGSAGGSLLEGVYNKDAQERILNYYRHMNIVGSQ
jgi:hypothetical protein